VFGIDIETCPACGGGSGSSPYMHRRSPGDREDPDPPGSQNACRGTEPVTQVSRSSASGAVWPSLRESTLPPAIAAALADAAGGLVVRRPESGENWALQHQK
jgi:hypothetical protein